MYEEQIKNLQKKNKGVVEMSEFGSLSGISSVSGASYAREKDMQDTTGVAARFDQSAFGNNVDLNKGQVPEGCRELGWG